MKLGKNNQLMSRLGENCGFLLLAIFWASNIFCISPYVFNISLLWNPFNFARKYVDKSDDHWRMPKLES